VNIRTSFGWRVILILVLGAAWGAAAQPAATGRPPAPSGGGSGQAAGGKLREDAPEPVKALWAQREKIRADRAKALAADLKQANLRTGRLRRGTITGSETTNFANSDKEVFTFRTREDKEAAIAAAVALAARLQSDLTDVKTLAIIPPTIASVDDLKVGTIGYVYAERVLQVFDPKTVAMNVNAIRGSFAGVPMRGGRKDVCMSNFDASELTDGQKYDKVIAIYVKGTRTFKTSTGGQRTVFVAEVFNADDYLVH
jgi:hypothetical protein